MVAPPAGQQPTAQDPLTPLPRLPPPPGVSPLSSPETPKAPAAGHLLSILRIGFVIAGAVGGSIGVLLLVANQSD